MSKVNLITTCPLCGNKNHVTVEEEDYLKLEEGTLIQDAFPYLSATDREKLISGLCEDCQKNIFSDENDDI